MSRLARAAAAALAAGSVVPWLLLLAPAASAHASLVSSSPAQGARLEALPDRVVFEFSEEMDPTAYVVVTGPDGGSLVDGPPVVEGGTVTQALADGGGDGGYLMAVKGVSADGHAVTGRVEFVVGEGELPSAAGTGATAPGTGDDDTAAEAPASSGASAATPGTSPAPAGRPLWVWSVGPACLLAAAAMWLAGSRASESSGTRAGDT